MLLKEATWRNNNNTSNLRLSAWIKCWNWFVDTLRTENCRHFAEDIFKRILWMRRNLVHWVIIDDQWALVHKMVCFGTGGDLNQCWPGCLVPHVFTGLKWSCSFNSYSPVSHICVSESAQIGSDNSLVPNLNRCWIINNWTPRNKLQWNFYQNTQIFICQNASENIVCGMVAILHRGRWVNRAILRCLYERNQYICVIYTLHLTFMQ